MSELSPRSAAPGDFYRTALGLRLLPVGSVIRTGPHRGPIYFAKVSEDAWVYATAGGDERAPGPAGHTLGSRLLPFRSEQIHLPAALMRLGVIRQEARR